VVSALALLACAAIAQAQQPSAAAIPTTPTANFTVFVRGSAIGTEQMEVRRTADGWTIAGSGRLGAPLNLETRRIELRYDAAWRPLSLSIDATVRDAVATVKTTVTGTSAKSDLTTNGVATDKTDEIAADAVLLPNPFFAAYEALAARLKDAAQGASVPLYVVPQGSVVLSVGPSSSERIQTLDRRIEARRTRATMVLPGGAPPLDLEIWSDEAGRLLRVSVPAQSLEVARDDIASVSSRVVTSSRPNDEQVFVPANGFNLAATVSRPLSSTEKRLPAVILVGGSGPTDRDETVANIPVFGQLAAALADAGYWVIRYDKRGVGQSGGRTEAATLADFAEDARAVAKFVSDRKDVDNKRIGLVGHSEGGAVGLLAASREKRIAALAMIGAPGVTGSELNMQQVRYAIDRAQQPDAQRTATIELQTRIQQAVLTGKGWETIPANLRRQADTPWFQSYLSFDPAKPMKDARQPLLVIQGLLDRQVEPSNADRLEALAKQRKRGTVEVVKLAGVNHILVPAVTGEVEEYQRLETRTISPGVPSAIADWLGRMFRPIASRR
jgi:hypothetical protein